RQRVIVIRVAAPSTCVIVITIIHIVYIIVIVIGPLTRHRDLDLIHVPLLPRAALNPCRQRRRRVNRHGHSDGFAPVDQHRVVLQPKLLAGQRAVGDLLLRGDTVVVLVGVILDDEIPVVITRQRRELAVRHAFLVAHAVIAPIRPTAGKLVRDGVNVGDGGGAVAGHGNRDGQVLAGAVVAGRLDRKSTR